MRQLLPFGFPFGRMEKSKKDSARNSRRLDGHLRAVRQLALRREKKKNGAKSNVQSCEVGAACVASPSYFSLSDWLKLET